MFNATFLPRISKMKKISNLKRLFRSPYAETPIFKAHAGCISNLFSEAKVAIENNHYKKMSNEEYI